MEERNANELEEDCSSDDNDSLELYYEPQATLNLTIKNEINYWHKYVIFHFIYMPDKCPQCGKNNIKLGNANNLVNPVRLVCSLQ